MKQVLLYENRKCGPTIWDISTKALEQKAYAELFKLLDEEWLVYSDLKDHDPPDLGCEHTCPHHDSVAPEKQNSYERGLYQRAKAGDAEAIKQLLKYRNNREYECYQICKVK